MCVMMKYCYLCKEFFKKIIVKHFPFCKEKEILVDYIFERFKSDKIDTLTSGRDDIELQEFMIALSILS